MRRLIYQTANNKYVNKVVLQTKQLENKDRVINVKKFKSIEQQEIEQKKQNEEELQELDDLIGFTNVIKHIVNSVS